MYPHFLGSPRVTFPLFSSFSPLQIPASPDTNARDSGLIPWLARSPGGGNRTPLQYSCIENPMERGAWWATVQGVAKSWAQLSTQHFHFSDTNKMQALRFLEITSLGALRLDRSDRFPLASIWETVPGTLAMGRTAGKDSQGALTGSMGSQSHTLDQGSLRSFSLGAELLRWLWASLLPTVCREKTFPR